MTATKEISLTRWVAGREYWLCFDLSELGNAIALCGWTLANQLDRTDPDVRAELDRLEALDGLDIPDGRAWFAEYATRVR